MIKRYAVWKGYECSHSGMSEFVGSADDFDEAKKIAKMAEESFAEVMIWDRATEKEIYPYLERSA